MSLERPDPISPGVQRALFFLAGATLTVACALALFAWDGAVPYGARAANPAWLRLLHDALLWIPWAVAAVLVLLRLRRGRHYRVLSYLAGACASFVLLLFLVAWRLLLAPAAEDYSHRRAFDARLWRDQERVAHDARWPPRLCMVDDLLASGRLDGLSHPEVLELLGPPSDPTTHLVGRAEEISYWLGPERGPFGIDSEWLAVRFDAEGRVTRVWVWRD